MNLELRPAMAGKWKPPSPTREGQVDFGEKTTTANADNTDSEKSARALLELENSSLRRLVVELIEKNQRLREELHSYVQAGGGSQRSIQ